MAENGFTMTECLLSITITSTALLAVIGMLMGTLEGARDSRSETVAGPLVRQLAGEARELAGATEAGAPPQEVVVLLDQAMQVMGHSRMSGARVLEQYAAGASGAEAGWFAKMRKVPDERDALMDRIVITVESPAGAPQGQRKVLHYATLAPK